MPVIGEELRALLGMIPVRDRAGIARGNLAQETLANEANAEGQALLQQVNQRPMMSPGAMPRPAPPPVQLPPTMGTGRPGPADVDTTGSIEPPTPTSTTTVTAPPAGAAAQFDDQMARRAKMAGFNDIVSSLGLIINGAANRGPSQGSTRDTLLAQLGSGGQSVHDVTEIAKTREALIAADEARANRTNRIKAYQRETGADLERATAAVDTGNDVKALDPATIAQRQAAKEVGANRMDLETRIPELAAIAKLPEWQVRNAIRDGTIKDLISPDKLSKLQHERAQTQELGAKTEKEIQETGEKARADIEYQFYKAHPEAYKQLHKLESVEEAQAILASRKAFDKHQETAGPTAYADEAGYTRARREAIERGDKPPTRQEWENIRSPAKLESALDTKMGGAIGDAAADNYKKATEIEDSAQRRNQIQSTWAPDRTSGGLGVDTQLKLRATIARIRGVPDAKTDDDQVFHAIMNQYALDAVRYLPGQLAAKELEFLQSLKGSSTMSAQGLRHLHTIQDKIERGRVLELQKDYDRRVAQHPSVAKNYPRPTMPQPTRFLREDVEDNPDQVKALLANPDDPAVVADFEATRGPGMAEYTLQRERAKK